MKKILKVFLVVMCAFTTLGVFGENNKVEAATYTQRLSAPAMSNSYYYSTANPFYAAGLAPTAGLDADGNCTWYAFGRAHEILGRYPTGLSTGMPSQWYYQTTNFNKGSVAKVGAIAVWQNHVAVVESIDNGVITLSGSSYKSAQYPNGIRFLIQKGTQSQIAAMNGGGFIGYIYIVDNPEVVNPTPKPEEPENLAIKYQVYDELNYTNGLMNASSIAGNPNSAADIRKMKVHTNQGAIYYKTHMAQVGWENEYHKNGSVAGDGNNDIQAVQMKLDSNTAKKYDLYYATYIQDYGWSDWAKNDGISGSVGLSKGIKGLRMCVLPKGSQPKFRTDKPYIDKNNYVEPVTLGYQTHELNGAWTTKIKYPQIAGNGKAPINGIKVDFGKYNNDLSYRLMGTNGRWDAYRSGNTISSTSTSKAQAIQMNLKGAAAEKYDLYYAVNIEGYGWTDWGKNNAVTGSIGFNKGITAVRIHILPKGSTPSFRTANTLIDNNKTIINYQTAMSGNGWLGLVQSPHYSGIVKQNKTVKAFKAKAINGVINYRSHISNKGWEQGYVRNGYTSGDGVNNIEAIQMDLTGMASESYDLYYRVYAKGKGWLGWASEGKYAGSTGCSTPIEGIQIMLVKKGSPAPTNKVPCYFINK